MAICENTVSLLVYLGWGRFGATGDDSSNSRRLSQFGHKRTTVVLCVLDSTVFTTNNQMLFESKRVAQPIDS